jgi:integrase
MNYSYRVLIRKDQITKAGEHAVILRAIINRQKWDISLGFDIMAVNWDNAAEKVIYNKTGNINKGMVETYNLKIQQVKSICHSIIWDAIMMEENITIQDFKIRYKNPKDRASFYNWANEQIQQMKGIKTRSTIDHILLALNRLKEVHPDLFFRDINEELVAQYDKYLRTKYKLHINTIQRHHKDIKMLINLARRKNMYIKDAYKNFKTKKADTQRIFLNDEELLKLENAYKYNVFWGTYYECLRAFLFSCYTGLRLSDLKQITWQNIMENCLIFVPQKTSHIGKIMKLPLSDTARKYLGNDKSKVFNIPSDQVYNEILRSIGKELGIRKKITSHVGRHTFATIFLEKGGKVEVLKELLGHSKIETTLIYVHLTDKRMSEQVQLMNRL